MATVTLTATLPTTRKDGAGLAISEIGSVTFLINGTVLAQMAGPFSGSTVAFTDSNPPVGNDAYAFYVTDTAGLQGDVSAPVTVTVEAPAPPPPALNPPSAGILTAVVNP